MFDIRVRRFAEDPEAQGVIEPSDKTWQVVIGKNGLPTFYVTSPTVDHDGKRIRAYVPLDTFLPEGLKTKDIMLSEAIAEDLTPEEQAEVWAKYEAEQAANPIPCPR